MDSRNYLAYDIPQVTLLNLGGFDVLAQPFCATEVLRCVSSACRHWPEELEETPQSMTA